MQSEQQMIVETMHQPERMMNAPYLDSVEQREYQPLRTNITLDAQYIYVLQQEIQNGRKAKKWQDRTRIGINLGYSSRHAHLVSLVLSLQTGLVSPQFHCSYDDLFETTTGTQARSIPKSQWQYKVGFVKEPNKPTIMRAEQEVGHGP
jgi:hypothetical protein